MQKVLHKFRPANRSWLLVVLAILLLSGCGNPDRARIIGTWEITGGDQFIDRADSNELDDDSPIPPRLTMTFYRSGALETEARISGQISKKSGSWMLKSFDPETDILLVECVLTNQTTEHEIFFEQPDKIKLVPPNMAGLTRKLTFVRR